MLYEMQAGEFVLPLRSVMETVRVYHPDLDHTIDDPATVARRSYEEVWKAKGWRLHPPKQKKENE